MTQARVLIVDADLREQAELARAFGAAGVATERYGHAAPARAALRTEPFDVLVLDPQLPDADGKSLLEEVRAGDVRPPPLAVLLSADSELRAQELGRGRVDAAFAKPCDADALVARVRELLERRSGRAPTSEHPILLIDDSPTFREYLTMILQDQGYPVETAASGEEGLRAAQAGRPSALIVDGILPGIDGTTVIRRARLDAALRGVPCILLTAAQDAEAELRALDSGADAFVRKDEDPALIMAKLAALLRMSSGRHELAPSPLAAKRVLAVGATPDYRGQLASILDSEGYQAILASSGEEAIDLLSRQPLDCILLDMSLPGLGGVETCRQIKSSPGLRDVPLIMLTTDERVSMLDVLGLGADDCVSKAADLEVLKARLRAQLRRRQFEDETRRAREQLLRSETEAAAAISARQLAETRAQHVRALQSKNDELETAYRELQATQAQLVQSAKMASLGELVAGVAHEINNPLAFVLSHLDTVQRSLSRAVPDPQLLPAGAKDPWERAHSRLSEMNLGLERIRELVVKLRTFSRLDEGERKTVSVRECIESLLTILGHKLKDRIAVTTHYGEPDQLDCFPSLLTQAIMNLVANSVDAIEGPGTIDIRTGMAGPSYQIVVTDSGHGIPAPLRERVLEPFFTTKPVGQGTGLGLSISYSIVRKHDGTLDLSEAPGGGTRAVISLPLSDPPRAGG